MSSANPLNGAKLAASVLTVIGSISSFVGASGVLICYAILPQKRHFRHALIINLALSDAINGLNNSVSGLYILSRRRDMPDGPGCDANGFIGQLSVQATDLTILMIAVVTLIGIRQVVVIPDPSFRAKLILCTSIWVIPIITASIALSSDYFVPVKGNWCWIKERPSYLRYVLTHMWRFATIVFSTIIYIHIYIYLHKHFKRMPRSFYRSSHDDEDHTHDLHIALDQGHSQQSIVRAEQGELGETGYNTASSTAAPGLPLEPGAYEPKKEGKHGLHAHGDPIAAKEAMIKKTLLLNAYPIMYILLWLPGIANRIAEATGRPTVVLQILQASTQYVGLANAVTYGLNEQVIRQLRQFYGRPDARRRR